MTCLERGQSFAGIGLSHQRGHLRPPVRMSARRCREGMRAYRTLGNDADLAMLKSAIPEEKSHRKYVGSQESRLMELSGKQITEKEKAQLQRNET